MITLGVVLFIVGLLLPIPFVETIGILLIVVGVVLWILGGVAGRPVGGRRHWF